MKTYNFSLWECDAKTICKYLEMGLRSHHTSISRIEHKGEQHGAFENYGHDLKTVCKFIGKITEEFPKKED